MDLTYPNEKFLMAVTFLISRFDQKERIKKAYEKVYSFKSDELPPESKEALDELHSKMTAVKTNPGYYINDSIESMTDLELQHMAELIHSIYIDIVKNHY